jgi:hypothetical protein
MKTFATSEKRSAPAVRKARPYVHHPIGPVLQAQQADIRRILRSTGAQAKLTIGRPNDKYEQEADRIADKVMRMPEPCVQRTGICPECEEDRDEFVQSKPLADQISPLVQRQVEEEEEEEPIQAKLADGGLLQRQEEELEEEEEIIQSKGGIGQTPGFATDLESSIHSLRTSGQSLPPSTRGFFETRFGRDFSNVRVHTDSTAAQTTKAVQAKAFTVGNDVVFGSGQYEPQTADGKHLLAHELTHAVQQKGKKQNSPIIQRRVRVTSGAIGQILGYFHRICPGSWVGVGPDITGHANLVNNQSCTCLEDTVNDPNRTYRIQVDPVATIFEPEYLYNNNTRRVDLPKPTSGPRTFRGASPLVHMPDSAASTMDFGSFDPSGNAVKADNWRILAHELCGHARLNQGYTGRKGDRPEHDSTINTENQIAAEHGGPARGMYNDRRQGESYHCEKSNPTDSVFALVDGWHYETSANVQNPPITTGTMQGTVTASQLRIRRGPSLSESIIGHYPRGTVITLLCQTPGAMVIDNSLWDRTNMGYVSDKYVSRPPRTTPPSTTRTKLPTCDPMPRPTTGVIYGRISTAISRLRIRQAPSTSSAVLGSYNRGEMVSILCQTTGTDVLGSSIWDQTSRGYISDRYVERLPPNATVPTCSP